MKDANIHFKRVVIVGVGLLGASLGLALKNRGLAGRVIGVGRKGSPSLETALALGAIDEGITDARAAVAEGGGADLVVLATPVRQFVQNMKDIAGALKPGAIVTDVGSTKGEVCAWAKELLPAGVFVGSHPMAGSEKKGPAAARGDLYEGAVCIVCGAAAENGSKISPEPEAKRIAQVANLWRSLGMKVLFADAQTHDRWVAAISHVPHAVAYSLMNVAAREDGALAAIAGGFIDSTRIAGSDAAMWTDILLTNREAVVKGIGKFEAELAALKAAIERGDEKEILKRLDAARAVRATLVDPRKKD